MQTRRSARYAPATPFSAATPTSASSSAVSANASTNPTTPEYVPSDNEAAPTIKLRIPQLKAGSKRTFSEVNDQPPPSKRRQGRSSSVYVDIAVITNPSKKARFKRVQPTACMKHKLNSTLNQATRPASDNEDEGIIESDDALEYDENATPEESGDDGSDYQMSDAESLVVESIRDDGDVMSKSLSPLSDIDEDDVMLDAAIQNSLNIAANTNTKAGPSDIRKDSRSTRARQIAAVVERRLKQQAEEIEEFQEDDGDSSDDEALSGANGKKKQAKGKRIVVTKSKASKGSKHGDLGIRTLADIRKERAEKRKLARQNKEEEAGLSKKLGRRLTYAEKSTLALHKHHTELVDVWGDLERTIPIPIPQKAVPPSSLKAVLLPFQLESLHWIKEQEKGIWSGGLLADEMGPTVAVMQWRNEIEIHTTGLTAKVWHGAARETDAKELQKFDVVITTYAVLESCFRKQQSGFKRKGKIVKEKSLVHHIEWNRIILDEAHNIKERSTNTTKAAFELKAKYRWCLSGTPLQNRVGELYSMIRFLGGDPFSYYFCKQCDCKSLHWKFSDKRSCDDCGHSPMKHTCFWNNEILTPIQKNGMSGPGGVAFKKLRILLDRMMLRRTKVQRADDLGLPPRTVVIRRDYFSPEEKELYQSLFSDAKRQFTTFVDSGTILNNYSNIFSLLTRMRQMACHPDLVLRSKTNAATFLPENLGEATLCRLCNDIAEDAIQARCRHIFDRECIRQYLDSSMEENVCRLEGTMSPQARDATIKHFMNNVHVTVFLVSLKAGGVALNLTEASRVYLMDSWWNPAVEYQAMDRIHRLGQHRPVQAIKLIVEDSIESRIIQLQEKKSAMVDATLSTDDSAMGRLTTEDLGFLFRL
ncbi:hypothetical protein EUX98_g2039 [Antrodiella citrinella]|uniref:DNA repair protein RAD16 n=1 Tax=Antrodiella citrinella TaxID=2447956 RepID=A0A4S4N028_9APHY|nr:hypothetical protein EUX98_g2039 [Antrodiella citrinella]